MKKKLRDHGAAPAFALGLMAGLIVLVATEGRVNLLALAFVTLIFIPGLTLTAVHLLPVMERRQLKKTYNQTYNRPDHEEGPAQ